MFSFSHSLFCPDHSTFNHFQQRYIARNQQIYLIRGIFRQISVYMILTFFPAAEISTGGSSSSSYYSSYYYPALSCIINNNLPRVPRV